MRPLTFRHAAAVVRYTVNLSIYLPQPSLAAPAYFLTDLVTLGGSFNYAYANNSSGQVRGSLCGMATE